MNRSGVPLALAAVLLASAFGAFLAPPARALDATGRLGGTLRVGLIGTPVEDPLAAGAWADGNAQILELIYDSLARIDPVNLEIVPWAADSWSYDEAATLATVELRADLQSDEGEAITAADVKTSLEQYSALDTATITAVDADTLTLNFSAGDAGHFWITALTAMLAWDEAGSRQYSGAFAVSGSTPTTLTLVANGNYWQGRPNLDSIVYTVYPDMTTLSCAMLLDDGAMMDLIGFHLVPNDLYTEFQCGFTSGETNRSLINPNQAKTQPWTLLVKNPGTKFLSLGFNFDENAMLKAEMPFRQAVYAMLNKQLYNQIEPNSVATHALTPAENTAWFLKSWAYVTDPGFTGSGAAKRTNADAAIQALVQAGYIDWDGDGWREDLTGADFSLDLSSPDFQLDPRKTTIAQDVQTIVQKAGIQVNHLQEETWANLSETYDGDGVREADLYLDVYDPATTHLGFLYDLAALRDADDTDVDTHLDLAADATSFEDVRLHLNHVMYYAGQNAVMAPLLHFDSLEVVNTMNFEGWVNSVGGANNFWSMIALSKPFNGPMDVSILLPPNPSVNAGSSFNVTVQVTDEEESGVIGATVHLAAGATLVDAVDVGTLTGPGNGPGKYNATLRAPTAVEAPTDWSFTATAYRQTYQSDSDAAAVTVYPVLGRLVIETAWSPDREITGDDTATLTVTVRNKAGLAALPGATVTVSLGVPGGEISPGSATAGTGGTATFTFSASVTQRTFYSVMVEVSADGFETESKTITVIANPEVVSPPVVKRTESVPGLEAVAVLAVVALLVAAMRVNRKKGN